MQCRWIGRAGFVLAFGLSASVVPGCESDSGSEAEEEGGESSSNGWAPAEFDASAFGWIMNVHGPASGSLYAVGGEFNETGGRMVHYDGSAWSPVDLSGSYPLLNWVYAFSDDDVIVVGNGGTVLRWDGSDWAENTVPTEQDLWGVWGAAPDDIWVVGGNGTEESDRVVLRFDGSDWTEAEIPELARPGVAQFTKVWGSSADQVVIVGQKGAVLRWDGTEFTEDGTGLGVDLVSVWGVGPDRFAIAGGRGNGVVARWDGNDWATYGQEDYIPGLNGVWMGDEQTIYVAGTQGELGRLDFDTLQYERIEVDTELDFHAIFGRAGGTITAVGGSLPLVQGPYEGVAYQWNP